MTAPRTMCKVFTKRMTTAPSHLIQWVSSTSDPFFCLEFAANFLFWARHDDSLPSQRQTTCCKSWSRTHLSGLITFFFYTITFKRGNNSVYANEQWQITRTPRALLLQFEDMVWGRGWISLEARNLDGNGGGSQNIIGHRWKLAEATGFKTPALKDNVLSYRKWRL